jgi:hypothetical protein
MISPKWELGDKVHSKKKKKKKYEELWQEGKTYGLGR